MSIQDAARAPSGRWLGNLVLAVAAVLALWFLFTAAFRYLNYSPAVYGADYWGRRAGLIPHIGGGVVAISTGLVQVWLGVTGRTRRLHVVLGRVYLGAVATGSLAGFWLALTTSGGLVFGSGLFFLSTAWAITTVMAYLAIRRRAVEQHREWMLRSYVVTFAFVFFRLGAHQLIANKFASPADADPLMAWACWSVPLLLAEPLLQYRKMKRR